MRFALNLMPLSPRPVLPFNYQYPLSAAIFHTLAKADSAYAAFLHDTGYMKSGSLKNFKLFTFSDLQTPFSFRGDRLFLTGDSAGLVVSFHIPHAAENFIRGIFINQRLEIADKKSKAIFNVQQIEALIDSIAEDDVQEIILQPLSPVVCGIKNKNGNYTFLEPGHPDFTSQLIYNWKEKFTVVYGAGEAEKVFEATTIEVILFKDPPKSRLITIKAGSPAETKIRGFTNFRLKVKSAGDALELLLNAGVGLYNSMGMGCVEVVM